MASYKYTKFLSVQILSHYKPYDGQKERSSHNYHFSEICEGSKLLWKCPEGVYFDVKKDKTGSDLILLKNVHNNFISDYIDCDSVYIANPSGSTEDFVIEVCSIFASNRKKWISETIEPSTPIRNIALPGTHDSAAVYRNKYSIDPYACQTASIHDQLQGGVRLFDIRLKADEDETGNLSFTTCHGDKVSVLEWNEFEEFSKVIAACKTFLSDNPGEFIVMSIKIDDYNNADTNEKKATVKNALKTLLYDSNGELFTILSKERTQRYSDVVGKIVVIERFDGDFNSEWKDNTTFEITYGSTGVYVQDLYDSSYDEKKKAIAEMLDDTLTSDGKENICINFCSGYYGIIKHQLASSAANLLGDRITDSTQVANLGWLLFDYIFSTFNLKLNDGTVELVDIIDLIIDANQKEHKYYGYHTDNS